MSFTHIDCFSGPGGICTGKGIAILGDIGTVLKDLQKAKEESAFV